NQITTVARELKLPRGVFPVAGLCVGYPADVGHVSMRLPPSLTIHTDEYDDHRLAADIEDYDRRRHARHAIPQHAQRQPDRFDHCEFYGWSEDKARQATESEGVAFAAYLKETWLAI